MGNQIDNILNDWEEKEEEIGMYSEKVEKMDGEIELLRDFIK